MVAGPRLVVFDIDGTLLNTDGIGREAFAEILEDVYGVPTSARNHDMAGKTDRQILYEVMLASGLTEEAIAASADKVYEGIKTLFETRLTRDRVTLLPGIPAILRHLSGIDNVHLGLLTGNLEPVAWIKLRLVDIDHFFRFGAFGSDARDRNHLPEIALERALQHTGIPFTASMLTIIGDTPNDIRCGKHVGCKTIAVATGQYSFEELQACEPDFLFHTLEKTRQVIDAIFS